MLFFCPAWAFHTQISQLGPLVTNSQLQTFYNQHTLKSTAPLVYDYDRHSSPKPPIFKPLNSQQTTDLKALALRGDDAAMTLLLTRIYWHASKLCFTKEEFLSIKDIKSRALSQNGYIYWNAIYELNLFDDFPGLGEHIIKLAKDNKLATAQHMYARMLKTGHGFSSWLSNIDLEQSVVWLKKASAQNFSIAKRELAKYYAFGTGGLIKNPSHALKLTEDAANQGYLPALYDLGTHYFNGKIVDKDKIKAFKLLFNSNQESQSLPPWLTHTLTRTLIKEESSSVDTTIFLANIISLQDYYYSQINYESIKNSLGTLSWQSAVQSEFITFWNAYYLCMEKFKFVINLLPSIEPGFLINYYDFTGPTNNFLKTYKINDQKYLCIGEENNTIAAKIAEYVKAFKAMKKAWKKIENYCAQELMYYTAKYERNYKRALALESMTFTQEERLLVSQLFAMKKIELQMHKDVIPDFQPVLTVIGSWICCAEKLHDELMNIYLAQGAPGRNSEFLELYKYFK